LRGPCEAEGKIMPRTFDLNPTSENERFLTLFISNGGGW
jgi:hypothetical protein